MEIGLLHLHSILRWVILALLILAILKTYSGWKQRKALEPSLKKVALFTLIAAHTTLLVGIYQLLLGRYGILNGIPEGISVMKDKFYRFYWIEHPTLALIAVVLITIANGKIKKATSDNLMHKNAFLLYVISLALLLSAIPWPFREIVGRGLVAGMK